MVENEKGKRVPSAFLKIRLRHVLGGYRKSPANTALLSMEKSSWGIGPRGVMRFSLKATIGNLTRPPVLPVFALVAGVIISVPEKPRALAQTAAANRRNALRLSEFLYLKPTLKLADGRNSSK